MSTNVPQLLYPSPTAGVNWAFVFNRATTAGGEKKLSPNTLKAYRSWIRKFQLFVKNKSYDDLGQQDAIDFLSSLAEDRKMSVNSQHQAFNAMMFLYRDVLKKSCIDIGSITKERRISPIPVVLDRSELDLIFDNLSNQINLAAKLLYGCGLLISECASLRVRNIDLNAGFLTLYDYRAGKERKNRSLPIPKVLIQELDIQLQKVSTFHEHNLMMGYAGAFMPENFDVGNENIAKEFAWQWLFPAPSLTLLPGTYNHKHYHLHESVMQKAIKQAVTDSGIGKRATAMAFRHSFACHLLEANYDIRAVQKMLGHSNLRSTSVYTGLVKKKSIHEFQSPLDF